MRFSSSLTAFAGLAMATNYLNDPNSKDIGKSLESVYGPQAPVDRVVPWHERQPSDRALLPPQYFHGRRADRCSFPMEVVLMQDSTASLEENAEEIRVQLRKMYDGLTKVHPDTKFGVTQFRDKYQPPFGDPNNVNYCFMIGQWLTAGFDELQFTYDNWVWYGGGGDPMEYQFGALIATAESNTTRWIDPLATRLIVVITDSQAHHKEDGLNKPEYNFTDYSGHYMEPTPVVQCMNEYYPTPEMVKDAIWKREAYVAFMVFGGESNERRTEPIDFWRWFSRFLDQPDDFVVNIEDGGAHFWDRLAEVIAIIEEAECKPEQPHTPPECECPHHQRCGCPAVDIRLREKPKHLELELNDEAAIADHTTDAVYS